MAELRRARGHDVGLDRLHEFALEFKLPKVRGRVSPNWFSDSIIDDDVVRLFASETWTVVPIIYAFLTMVVQPKGILADNIRCFGLLARILSILSGASDTTDAVYAALQTAIDEHAPLFVRLYPLFATIKFHHLLHLPDDLRRLKKVVSCFVTERKHRDLKRLCMHVFRNVERTTTIDFVNYYVEELVHGRFRFEEQYLIDHRTCSFDGIQCPTSTHAQLAVGVVSRGDIVYARLQDVYHVVEIDRLFSSADEGELLASVKCYLRETDDVWIIGDCIRFINSRHIVANLTWAVHRPGAVFVLRPTLLCTDA